MVRLRSMQWRIPTRVLQCIQCSSRASAGGNLQDTGPERLLYRHVVTTEGSLRILLSMPWMQRAVSCEKQIRRSKKSHLLAIVWYQSIWIWAQGADIGSTVGTSSVPCCPDSMCIPCSTNSCASQLPYNYVTQISTTSVI